MKWKNITKRRVVAGVLVFLVLTGLLAFYFIFKPFEKRKTVIGEEHGDEHTFVYNEDLSQEKGKPIYTCPMHPQVISDRPGTCPICGMDLVKKQSPTAIKDVSATDVKEVSLSPSQQVLANVAVTTVKREVINKEITTVGEVTYDETTLHDITAWVDGRISKLYIDFTGEVVSKGDLMLEIYSPELVSTQQEYLQAHDTYLQLKDSNFEEIASSSFSILEAARMRLLLWGIKEFQIEQLERTRTVKTTVPIYAPSSGVVINKKVQEGQYVKTGEVLFDLANLSTVWVEADIYQYEMGNVSRGQSVRIKTDAYPRRLFAGSISFIYPFFQPESNTVKVRVAIPNQDLLLKPGMIVNAEIDIYLGNPVVIPRTAVMITGKRNLVWIEKRAGTFVPREIELGDATEDFYTVLSGLKEGERVVSSGGFLVDSESEINTMPGMNMPGMDMPDIKDSGNDMNMSEMNMNKSPNNTGRNLSGELDRSKADNMDMSNMTMD